MTSLDEFAETAALVERLTASEKQAAVAKTDLSVAKAQLEQAHHRVDDLQVRVDVYEACVGMDPPNWLVPKRPGRGKAIVCSMLSDTHWDEVVSAVEMDGRGCYNRVIAEQRLRRFTDKTIELARDYTAGVDIEGLVLILGGDLVSGLIHEELRESNECSALETVVFWAGRLAATVTTLADHFGTVHCPAVVGNHGRMTRKPRMKGRVRDNLDWLLVTTTATHLAGDDRITWQISESADCLFSVYNTRHLLTHGDQVKGGGGIGGIWPPIMRLRARKQVNCPHDVLIMGHWHQLVQAASAGLIVNGCTKGPDEFAAIMNFPDEPPQQAWWLVTPEHGVTVQSPIFVMDKQKEKWA